MRDPDPAIDELRQVRQARNASKSFSRQTDAVRLEDFYAYMLEHKYIFAPAGQVWPLSSVDARLPAVGKLKASAWLDQNRPVEQMTWAPGEKAVIADRLIADGGWIPRPGCHVYNLYRAPILQPMCGNPDPWLHPHREALRRRRRAYRALVRSARAEAARQDQPRSCARRQTRHRQGHAPGAAQACGRRLEFSGGIAATGARPVQRLPQVGDPARV